MHNWVATILTGRGHIETQDVQYARRKKPDNHQISHLPSRPCRLPRHNYFRQLYSWVKENQHRPWQLSNQGCKRGKKELGQHLLGRTMELWRGQPSFKGERSDLGEEEPPPHLQNLLWAMSDQTPTVKIQAAPDFGSGSLSLWLCVGGPGLTIWACWFKRESSQFAAAWPGVCGIPNGVELV